MIKGALIDFDGTIVNSEESRRISINYVLSKLESSKVQKLKGLSTKPKPLNSITISEKEWHDKYVPLPTRLILEEIKRDNNLDFDTEEMYVKSHEYREEYLKKNGLDFVKGFKEFYEFLLLKNIKICVCSGGAKTHVKNNLKAMGLGNLKLVSRDDVSFEKPHPEIYLKGIEVLNEDSNIDKSEIIAFDDSLSGIQSAIAAGLKVIAVNYAKNIGIEKLNCYKWIDDYTELDFEEIIK
jgi:HAD superfamily hydrolase (TIGR01509 family)